MAAEWDKTLENIITTSEKIAKENRIGLMNMLLWNLGHQQIKDVQNIASKVMKRKKYSTIPTNPEVGDGEDWWWEWECNKDLRNWAGSTEDTNLICFIKSLLPKFRRDEIQEIKSTHTSRTKFEKLHPKPAVSRLPSVPAGEGWWSEYTSDHIIAVDCEMVSKIIEWKLSNDFGQTKPRCKQLAGKVAVVDYNGNTVYSQLIYHRPADVYLTSKAKEITGFQKDSFVNGRQLSLVQADLEKIFKNKLLILIGAGSDFGALEMEKRKFDVFDLHQFYEKDSGKIGLRSLVDHFYDHLDIQVGVHDPLVDAKYTMKIFKEHYIPYKLKHKDEVGIRRGLRMFNEIETKK